MFLFECKFPDLPASEKASAITVEVLPKKLDEEIARYMVEGFWGVITQLSATQAEYINVPVEGRYKAESSKYSGIYIY
jgi:adenosylhomocysteinase